MNSLSELGLYLMVSIGAIGIFAAMGWIAFWSSGVIRERWRLYLEQEQALFLAIYAVEIALLGFVFWVVG